MRHANPIKFDYTLHQQRLEEVQSAKYLGITISDDLDWGQHISEISAKTTKTLGFLWRNLAFASRHTKEVAYKTLVHPNFCFCFCQYTGMPSIVRIITSGVREGKW